MGRIKQVRKITAEMAERISEVLMQPENERKECKVLAWKTQMDFICYKVWFLCDVLERQEILGFYFDRQGIMHIEKIPTALLIK
jgi:nitrate/nitrite transporter NarK